VKGVPSHVNHPSKDVPHVKMYITAPEIVNDPTGKYINRHVNLLLCQLLQEFFLLHHHHHHHNVVR